MNKIGVLLVNLGTPDDTSVSSVRRYLKEFLLDPRVIDLPTPLRHLLVYGAILPFRPFKSAEAYKKVWHEQTGSPLRHYSEQVTHKLQAALGDEYQVAYGMRYGNPSVASALAKLKHCQALQVIPMFPQYSSAATGSAMAKVLEELSKSWNIPKVNIIDNFHDRPEFISAYAGLIKQHLKPESYLLFSYHGLPERHIDKSECQVGCDKQQICPAITAKNYFCYRAQCYATSSAIATHLGLDKSQFSTSFQSRLGRIPWIKPYTDHELERFSKAGIKHLSVVCPSFVADCLETIEEIGMQAREQWQDLGGESFTLIPCLNAEDAWVEALQAMLKVN